MGPREGGSPAEQGVTSDLTSRHLGSVLRARKEEGSLCSAAPPPKYWRPCQRGAQDGKRAELWPWTLRLSLGFALGPATAAAVAPASGTSDSSGREESSPPHKSGPTAEDKQFLRESHVSPAHLWQLQEKRERRTPNAERPPARPSGADSAGRWDLLFSPSLLLKLCFVLANLGPAVTL